MMHWRTPAGKNGNTILCHKNTIILLSTRRRGALASDATKEAGGFYGDCMDETKKSRAAAQLSEYIRILVPE